MFSVTVKSVIKEKLGMLLKLSVWVLARPLGFPSGMAWLTVKVTFVVIGCASTAPPVHKTRAANAMDPFHFVYGTELIAEPIIQIIQPFAMIFFSVFGPFSRSCGPVI